MSSIPLIPQSLDEAINQAQFATQKALDDGLTRLQVELVFPEIPLKAQMITKKFADFFGDYGTGLKGVGDRYPSQLSGGMRKRVSFARAIMVHPTNIHLNPEVILYDEPTAGLDPIASTVIENLVCQLKDSTGVCSTYIMVSHQDSTIRNTAKRIIFLYGGKIIWEGRVEDLENIDNIDNEYVQQFFKAKIEGPIRVIE